jgi:hypothetical protein
VSEGGGAAGPQVCKDLDTSYMDLYLKAHQMATDGTTVREAQWPRTEPCAAHRLRHKLRTTRTFRREAR